MRPPPMDERQVKKMSKKQRPSRTGLCANCGRIIKSRQNRVRGEGKTICSQCYRELAYGDLQGKVSEIQGRG